MLFGQAPVSVADIWHALLGQSSAVVATIVWDLRLPRMLVGVLVGASLGLAGAAMQGLLRNPLAEPGVVGFQGAQG